MAKQNGITNVDTKQMEEMRAQVVEQELSARSWKAYYEKMYYSMEAEKLEPEYALYKQRLNDRLAKEKEEYEKFLATMKEQLNSVNEQSNAGELKIEEPETDAVDLVDSQAPIVKM